MENRKVVVVTGAASGMGRAAALRWAGQGHRVAGVDRFADALKDLETSTPGFSAFECDVSDEEAVRKVAGEVRSRLGEIDRLVNAAGICISGRIGELEPAAFRKTMEVNYFGTVHWVDAVIGPMRTRRSGEIVLFSSVGGFLPGPGVDAYIASKFAVLGYAEVLRQQSEKDGIRVICICPPPVDTPLLASFMEGSTMHPAAAKLMKPMTPHQIVDSIDKALAGKGFLLLPGVTAKASYVGRRVAPNLVSRLLARAAG